MSDERQGEITAAEVAANILNESNGISSLIVAWCDKDGDLSYYCLGSVLVQEGLLHVLSRVVGENLDDLLEEGPDDRTQA